MSSNHKDPDLSAELFMLEPEVEQLPRGDGSHAA
jgi:hypothetical protein